VQQQAATAASGGAPHSKRTEFMLETLRDLRHNKRRMAAETPALTDMVRSVRAIRQREGGA
jgi:hypothetical protein